MDTNGNNVIGDLYGEKINLKNRIKIIITLSH